MENSENSDEENQKKDTDISFIKEEPMINIINESQIFREIHLFNIKELSKIEEKQIKLKIHILMKSKI